MSDRGEFVLHAWVDESVHVDCGLYVLAAGVADPVVCDGHRDVLRALVRSPRRRLHWKDEERRDRLRIAESLATLDLAHIVAIASPLDPKKPERARRKCLERLLLQLSEDGVGEVWLESRGPIQDQRDRTMVAAMRSAGIGLRRLHVEFALPRDEPMLWVPDAVAGAVAAARKGTDMRFRRALGSGVVELDIPL